MRSHRFDRFSSRPSRRFAGGTLALLLAAAVFVPAVPAQKGLADRMGVAADEAPKPEPTENPFLWRIEGTPPSFLFGTMHVSDPRVTTLPNSVKEALDEADALFTEIPMDMETQMSLGPKMFTDKPQPLSERFTPEAQEALKAAMTKRPLIPMEAFEKFTFTGMYLTLATIDYAQELFKYGNPLDMQLASNAVAAGKQTGGLEDPMSQVTILEGFTKEQESKLLLGLLEKLDDSADMNEKMIEMYVDGDIDAMLELMMSEMDRDDEVHVELWERMLDRRNRVMADGIHERITHNQDMIFFFAVGAAHYPGEMGVLQMLEDMGYELTRLKGDDAAIRVADDTAMAGAH